MRRQKAVSAYFTSKQILPFAFAEQYTRALCEYNTTAWTNTPAKTSHRPSYKCWFIAVDDMGRSLKLEERVFVQFAHLADKYHFFVKKYGI